MSKKRDNRYSVKTILKKQKVQLKLRKNIKNQNNLIQLIIQNNNKKNRNKNRIYLEISSHKILKISNNNNHKLMKKNLREVYLEVYQHNNNHLYFQGLKADFLATLMHNSSLKEGVYLICSQIITKIKIKIRYLIIR